MYNLRRGLRQRANPRVAVYLFARLGLVAMTLAGTPAGAAPQHAAMVIDANTGQVLHSHAGDEPRHPASLAKMMTLYIAFDLIDQGRLSYASKIKISAKAAAVAPSKLDLDPGEEIQLIDGIKALITKSANDVAVAIAEEIAGTEANFAKVMTARAREIGMTNTTFRNASGLPDPDQVTTARDMLTLALRLQDDFPKHFGLFATREFTYNGGTFRNHNTLLRSFQGTNGIKTGYTRASGFNLAASVRRDGKHIVGVIFGGHSAPIRNANMRMLLTNALAKASTETTRKPAAVARMTPVPRPARPSAAAKARPKPETPLAPAAPGAPGTNGAAAPPALAQGSTTPPEPAASVIPIAKVRRVMVTPKVALASSASSTAEEPVATPAKPPATAPSAALPPAPPTSAGMPAEPLRAAGSGERSAESDRVRAPSGEQTAAAPSASPARMGPGLNSGQTDKPAGAKKAAPASKVPAGAAPRVAPAPGPSQDGSPSAARPSPRTASGGYHIQIGAYGSAAEAERQLGVARERTAELLATRQPVTQIVQKGTRQLFRARFAGFDSPGAASACAELKRQQIDCFVMKGE